MRKIGSLSSPADAKQFQLYLDSLALNCQVQSSPESWDIWIVEEDHLVAAREALAEFQANPSAEKFAAPVPRQPASAPQPAAEFRRKRPSRPSGEVYATFALILASLTITLVTNFGNQRDDLLQQLWFTRLVRLPGRVIPPEIWHGEIWRLWTPIFLHLNELHLLFNMVWLWRFGGQIEILKGWKTLTVLVLVFGAMSNFAQYYFSGGLFGGMSGVIYGLFGYVWMRARWLPEENFWIDPDAVLFSIAWLFICMTGIVGPIANVAHVSGLLVGLAAGAFPLLWRSR